MDTRRTKLLLITSILSMSIACVWLVLSKIDESKPETQLLKIQNQIRQQQQEPDSEIVPIIPEVISEINARNSQITSISSQDIAVKIWEGGMRFRLKGDLCFEKENLFRMRIRSLLGEEVDLGSNKELFWYWSRRDQEPGVYFAYYEDLSSTRLKTPFNPIFLRTSLGILEIETKDVEIVEKDGFLAVIRQTVSGTGKKVLHTVFVDSQAKRIKGFMVTDLNGEPLASCEIQSWENHLPKSILYTWHEEQKIMLIELDNVVVNESIPDSKWQIPNKLPKINMADE